MGTVTSPDGRFEWDEEKSIDKISARLAEQLEKERYDENYRNQVAGYER